MLFLLAEILNFQGSTHQYGVGSFSKLKDFAYFTFYGDKIEYEKDKQDNWSSVRKWLLLQACESAFSNLESEVFAYMKPEIVIKPENIIEYVPAEKWRNDVLKYFRTI